MIIFLKKLSILLTLFLANCLFAFLVNFSRILFGNDIYAIVFLSGSISTLLILIIYHIFKHHFRFIRNPTVFTSYLFIQSASSIIVHPLAMMMAIMSIVSENNSWFNYLLVYLFFWGIPNIVMFSIWYFIDQRT